MAVRFPEDELEPSADAFRETLKSEYDKDFDLKERLDNKASSMVTMAGVIATLFSGFSTVVLTGVEHPNPFLIGLSIVVLFVELILLTKTIWASIDALKMAKYRHAVVASYYLNNDKPNESLLTTWKSVAKIYFNDTMIREYLIASNENSALNESKARHLKEAQNAFLGAIIVVPFSAVLTVMTLFIK